MSVASNEDTSALEYLSVINNEGVIDFDSMEQLADFQDAFQSIVLVASNDFLLKNDFDKVRLFGFVWGYVSGLSLYLGYKSGSEFSSLLYALILQRLDCNLTLDSAFEVTEGMSLTDAYQEGMLQGSEDVTILANYVLETHPLDAYEELTIDILRQYLSDIYQQQPVQNKEIGTNETLFQTDGPIAQSVGKCLDCLIPALSYAKIDIFSLQEDEARFTFGYIAGVCDTVIKSSGEEINKNSAAVITTQVLARLFGEDKCHGLFESLITALSDGLPSTMTGYTHGEHDALGSFNSFPPLALSTALDS